MYFMRYTVSLCILWERKIIRRALVDTALGFFSLYNVLSHTHTLTLDIVGYYIQTQF